MDIQGTKLECLRLAVQCVTHGDAVASRENILELAAAFTTFIVQEFPETIVQED